MLLHKFNHSIENLLNLFIQFDENINYFFHASRIFLPYLD